MLFFSVMEKVYPVVMAIKHIANDTPVSKERLIAANTIGRSRVLICTLYGVPDSGILQVRFNQRTGIYVFYPYYLLVSFYPDISV